MIETCCQTDIRYYVQAYPHRNEWINHRHILYKSGFKSLKSAKKMLVKANRDICTYSEVDMFRLVKQTKTIEIKTTTEIEVLDD